MSQPPFQNPQFQNPQFPITHHAAVQIATHSTIAAILTVVRVEEIPAALSQRSNPVLIDIPEVQRRLSWLAPVQKWGGRLGRWIFNFLATWLLTQWLNAQLPNKDFLIPDWAKFNFERQPDNKVILKPLEE
jgi:hypothetical protein